MSVAFISDGGLKTLLQVFEDLNRRGINRWRDSDFENPAIYFITKSELSRIFIKFIL